LLLAACAAPAPERTLLSLQVSGAVERRLGLVSDDPLACILDSPMMPVPIPGEAQPPYRRTWLLRLGDPDREAAPRFRLEFPVERDGAPVPGTGMATLELDGRRWDGWPGANGGRSTLEIRPTDDLARGSFTARGLQGAGEVTVEGRWDCPRGYQAWLRDPR
jgi:hypothetical protein